MNERHQLRQIRRWFPLQNGGSGSSLAGVHIFFIKIGMYTAVDAIYTVKKKTSSGSARFRLDIKTYVSPLTLPNISLVILGIVFFPVINDIPVKSRVGNTALVLSFDQTHFPIGNRFYLQCLF